MIWLFQNPVTVAIPLFEYLYIATLYSARRDAQFGKLTVDDYGAKTGRSPGKMRQLNINGVLYVGTSPSHVARTTDGNTSRTIGSDQAHEL